MKNSYDIVQRLVRAIQCFVSVSFIAFFWTVVYVITSLNTKHTTGIHRFTCDRKSYWQS